MPVRLLGILGMLGAPFLLVDFLMHGAGANYEQTALSGLFSLVYISAWMCSIIGLWKLEAAGTGRLGRSFLVIQLFFLSLANVSNILLILQPGIQSPLYFVLDLFWPISNLFMIATGLVVYAGRRINGWMRLAPLLVAGWLPFCLLLFQVLAGRSMAAMLAGGAYSAIAWMLLGFVVLYHGSQQSPAYVMKKA